jgi:hypothetical protein
MGGFVILGEGRWKNTYIIVMVQTILFTEIMLNCEYERAADPDQIVGIQSRLKLLTEQDGLPPSFSDVVVAE